MNGRALLRIFGLVFLLAILGPIHVLTRALLGRSDFPRRFLAAAAWIVGARVKVTGARIGKHTLLISNHVTWLDILVLGGSTGCAFVSKDELGHPLIHWLADQNATVYVKRAHRKGAKDQAAAISEALDTGKPVALFPEGTTGPGDHLLPFRSTLLEAANTAPGKIRVRPIAIDYGKAAGEIGWWKESGRDNVLRLLGRAGTLPVSVNVLRPLDAAGGRKKLALEAREVIAQRLGLTSHHHSPIGDE